MNEGIERSGWALRAGVVLPGATRRQRVGVRSIEGELAEIEYGERGGNGERRRELVELRNLERVPLPGDYARARGKVRGIPRKSDRSTWTEVEIGFVAALTAVGRTQGEIAVALRRFLGRSRTPAAVSKVRRTLFDPSDRPVTVRTFLEVATAVDPDTGRIDGETALDLAAIPGFSTAHRDALRGMGALNRDLRGEFAPPEANRPEPVDDVSWNDLEVAIAYGLRRARRTDDAPAAILRETGKTRSKQAVSGAASKVASPRNRTGAIRAFIRRIAPAVNPRTGRVENTDPVRLDAVADREVLLRAGVSPRDVGEEPGPEPKPRPDPRSPATWDRLRLETVERRLDALEAAKPGSAPDLALLRALDRALLRASAGLRGVADAHLEEELRAEDLPGTAAEARRALGLD